LLNLRKEFVILRRRIGHREVIDEFRMIERELREMRVVKGANRKSMLRNGRHSRKSLVEARFATSLPCS
jgi:hypothetical protein